MNLLSFTVLSIYSSEPPTNPRSNFAGEERLSGGAAPSARAGGRATQEEGARWGHAEAGASPHLSSSEGREPRERGPADGAQRPRRTGGEGAQDRRRGPRRPRGRPAPRLARRARAGDPRGAALSRRRGRARVPRARGRSTRCGHGSRGQGWGVGAQVLFFDF